MVPGFPRTRAALTSLFPAGARAGLLFFSALFLAGLALNASLSVMGITQAEVASMIVASFWPHMLFIQLKILLACLLVGYVTGWCAELVARAFGLRFKGARLLWVALSYGYALLLGIKKYPQLYTEIFYDRGGIGKAFQLFVTDVLPLWAILIPGALLGLSLLAAVLLPARRQPRARALLAGMMIAIGLALMPSFFPPRTGNKGPNILILAEDSLRLDRLGSEGYERSLTPVIDELASEGVSFRSHYSSLPRTFPAMISFLTGRFPQTHGVRHMFPSAHARDHREHSFVELLRRNGYATAVVGDFAGDIFSRISIGFETVRAPYFNFVTIINQRSLEIHAPILPYLTNRWGRRAFPDLKELANNGDPILLADEAAETLAALGRRDKFACLVFFSAAHFPYAAPYPYYQKYTLPGYRGRFKYHKPPTIYEKERMTEEDVRQIHGLYDGAIESFDAAAGKLVAFLKKRGLLDNTIVIVTGDHGENLYEYDWTTGHGEHLRGDHVLRVPLIVRFPGQRFPVTRVQAVTRDVDVAPTLLEYLGLKGPDGMDGQSLMPLLTGRAADLNLTAFAETGIWFSDVTEGFYQHQRIKYPDVTGLSRIDFSCNMEVVLKEEYEALINTAKHRMVDDGRFRLIHVPTRQGVRYELYDRKLDPGFTKDISLLNPAVAARLKSLLERHIALDRSVVFRKGYAVPGGNE